MNKVTLLPADIYQVINCHDYGVMYQVGTRS